MTEERTRELCDITSRRRPDPRWTFDDARGHRHRWFVDGEPATKFPADVGGIWEVPTIAFVKTGEERFTGDDTPHDTGHYACRVCGAIIDPGCVEDPTVVVEPGLWYRNNGVPSEEFYRRWIGHIRDQVRNGAGHDCYEWDGRDFLAIGELPGRCVLCGRWMIPMKGTA